MRDKKLNALLNDKAFFTNVEVMDMISNRFDDINSIRFTSVEIIKINYSYFHKITADLMNILIMLDNKNRGYIIDSKSHVPLLILEELFVSGFFSICTLNDEDVSRSLAGVIVHGLTEQLTMRGVFSTLLDEITMDLSMDVINNTEVRLLFRTYLRNVIDFAIREFEVKNNVSLESTEDMLLAPSGFTYKKPDDEIRTIVTLMCIGFMDGER